MDTEVEILRWFDGQHLPSAEARVLVAQYETLATSLVEATTPGDERDAALRALLVSKDAGVRALLTSEGQPLEVPPGVQTAQVLEVAPDCWHVYPPGTRVCERCGVPR